MGTMARCGSIIQGIRVRGFGAIRPHAAGEVITTDDLGRGEGPRFNHAGIIRRVVRRVAGPAEGSMVVVNAAIEHRNPHTGSVRTCSLHRSRTDVGDRL